MDLVIRCANLPTAGQTVLAESSAEFCGGKGANQAVAAAMAGGDISMIGAVGGDAFAGRLLGNLTQHGVRCDAVARCDDWASGLAVISVDQLGQNSILVVPGANASVSRNAVLAAKTMIQRCDGLLVQFEIPLDAALAGIEIAKQAGVRVVVDPAPAPRDFSLELLGVDLLCPNELEAAELTGQRVKTVDDARSAAVMLHEMGAEHVAITMGGQGTLLHSEGESRLIPAFRVDVVDTTAAGDAFAGAVTTRWLLTGDLREAVRFGNAAGALAASKQGAQESMANQVTIENLLRSQA
jgi:ribokinase